MGKRRQCEREGQLSWCFCTTCSWELTQASSFLQSKAVRRPILKQRGEEQSIEVKEEVGGGRGKKCCSAVAPPTLHTIALLAQPHSHLPSTSLEEHLLPSLLHRVRL